jgi:hypothetical protein
VLYLKIISLEFLCNECNDEGTWPYYLNMLHKSVYKGNPYLCNPFVFYIKAYRRSERS